jgi:hypothetical protein
MAAVLHNFIIPLLLQEVLQLGVIILQRDFRHRTTARLIVNCTDVQSMV